MSTLARSTTRYRPTVAVVDLEAIRHNVRVLKPARAEVMAVVKADGYGHGAVPVARAALEGGATWLGVALVEEGLELVEAGLGVPILLLTEFPPGSERDALAAGLTPTLYTEEGLSRLAEAAGGASIGVHVKVDTGMHRVGLAPERTAGFLEEVRRAGLRVEGLWTHLAKSEELGDSFSDHQLERFDLQVARAKATGFGPRYVHAANSAAAIARPAFHFDLIRLGIAMYGLSPGPELDGMADLRPAMSWKSSVSMVKRVGSGEAISYGLRYRLTRESTIVTVPVGYADGYNRLLGNRGEVLIHGRRYGVAGAVTMDQIMVDCRDDQVKQGEEVVLMGRQGNEEIRAGELAAWAGTISYEVVCGVGARVPREYRAG